MDKENGIEEFLDYLDELEEMINIFKTVSLCTDIMSELNLSEEQIDETNVLLDRIQREWSENFLKVLKFGMEWVEFNISDEE